MASTLSSLNPQQQLQVSVDPNQDRLMVNAVLASLLIRDNVVLSETLDDLSSIVSAANGNQIISSVDFLLKNNLIKANTSNPSVGLLASYKIADENFIFQLCEWLEHDRENLVFVTAVRLIKASAKSLIWYQSPETLLSKKQLEELVDKHKHHLYLNSLEQDYLLESAIYQQSSTVSYWAGKCGGTRTKNAIKRNLLAPDDRKKINAARAVAALAEGVLLDDRLGDLLLHQALGNPSADVRRHCGAALALICCDSHIIRLKLETRKIRFKTFGLFYYFFGVLLNSFLSTRKDIFDSSSKLDRAMSVLVDFYAAGRGLREFSWYLRRRAARLYRRRRIAEHRFELFNWVNQGRIIGTSSALIWYFTVGTILTTTVYNIYLSGFDLKAIEVVLVVVLLLAVPVALGMLFGRSAAKSSFIIQLIYKKNTAYRYITESIMYRVILIFFSIGSIAFVNDFTSFETSYLMLGPLFFWLSIPAVFHLFNGIKFKHAETVRLKAYLGATILLFAGLVSGFYLSEHYQDIEIFYFFSFLGVITSLIFKVVYLSSGFCINRNTLSAKKHSFLEALLISTLSFVSIVSSIAAIAFICVYAFGDEALLGKYASVPMSYDSETQSFYIDSHYDIGPGDVNYYNFNIPGEELAVLTMPGENGNPDIKVKNALISFDRKDKIDFSYSAGEIYMTPPGRHWLSAESKDLPGLLTNAPIAFGFQIGKIKTYTPGSSLYFRSEIENTLHLDGFNLGEIIWTRQDDSRFWKAQASGSINKDRNHQRLRILKTLYTLTTAQSAAAELYVGSPGDPKNLINVYVKKVDHLLQVPTERFYYAERRQLNVHFVDDTWFLELYLFSPDLVVEGDRFKTAAFIDVSANN